MSARQEADVVIDGGDKSCTELLLHLRERLAGLRPGTLVHLLATDPAAPLDLAAWCHLTGHNYLGPVPVRPIRATNAVPGYALRVAAEARATRPEAPWHLNAE
ncbi:sulfurtransferase TusA family protein [Actinomadura sp. 3N508]|uniref:sulfurtransferase TusA family protein n=1 Tax=Actinomadura sp. 3N508 TaxID=3375153 RepID=UPI00379C5151